MKAVNFDYERASDLDALVARLAARAGDAKIIAGGQTLVPLLAMRLARPALLLDINFIAGLADVTTEDGVLAIGAMTRQAAALANPTVRREAPLLAKALGFVGHQQTRNRGTIGGSLANADPSAEIGLAALALGGEVRARSVRGERTIALEQFFRAAMETALEPDECLTSLRLPLRRAAAHGTGFQEVSVRASDFALAAAAVDLTVADGRCRRAAIALGGADTMPRRLADAEALLEGSRLDERDIAAAAATAAAGIDERYRSRIAVALVSRALAEAKAEAHVAA